MTDVKSLAIVSFTLLIAIICVAIGIAAWAYGLPPADLGGF